MNDAVTQQVRQFILSHIHSVAQLDMLLLLYNNPHRAWTADQVARELRIDRTGARSGLNHLEAHGLLATRDDGVRVSHQFQPETAALAGIVDIVAQAYLTRRVTIIGLIFSEPSREPTDNPAQVEDDLCS